MIDPELFKRELAKRHEEHYEGEWRIWLTDFTMFEEAVAHCAIDIVTFNTLSSMAERFVNLDQFSYQSLSLGLTFRLVMDGYISPGNPARGGWRPLQGDLRDWLQIFANQSMNQSIDSERSEIWFEATEQGVQLGKQLLARYDNLKAKRFPSP